MSEPVRIGVVGYGLAGRSFHAPLITSCDDLELVGVQTASAERREQLAADRPGVPAVETLEQLKDLGAEAVAVASTTGTHTEVTEAALDLGLHVVCDKPLAVTAAVARATVERAERIGLIVTPYQNRRWDSDFLTVRALLAEGRLGEVFRFESRFERWSPGPMRAWWRSDLPPSEGGGVRLDLGAHLVDQALLLFGPARHVHADSFVRRDGGRAEDDLQITLTHDSGVVSLLAASTHCGDVSRRLRVIGREGAYVVGGVDGQEDALRAGRTPRVLGEAWGAEPPARWGHLHRGADLESVPTERGRWDAFYPAFAAAVRGDGAVPVDPWDAVRALEVLDAAAVSAAEHRVVTLPG